jgi:hypothetical protein
MASILSGHVHLDKTHLIPGKKGTSSLGSFTKRLEHETAPKCKFPWKIRQYASKAEERACWSCSLLSNYYEMRYAPTTEAEGPRKSLLKIFLTTSYLEL